MILRIFVAGAIKREFGLGNKLVKFRSMLPCFDTKLLLVNCQKSGWSMLMNWTVVCQPWIYMCTMCVCIDWVYAKLMHCYITD